MKNKTTILAVSATALLALAVILYQNHRAKQREEQLRQQYDLALHQAQANNNPIMTLISSAIGAIL